MKKTKTMTQAKTDYVLLAAAISLLLLGIVMVTSASIVIAERKLGKPFYYVYHQVIYGALGILGALFVYAMPIKVWKRYTLGILVLCFVGLIAVLIPGLGRSVNGSTRWIYLGVASIQFAEFVKLGVILYLAGYIVKQQEALFHQFTAFLKPLLVLGVLCGLLILEPDFGTAVVIMGTSLRFCF